MERSKEMFMQLCEVEYYESEIGQLTQELLIPPAIIKQAVDKPNDNGKPRKS